MYDYNKKYKGIGDRLSVMEILQEVGTTRYRENTTKEYQAVDIDKVVIDGNIFKNYGQYSFIWEKTYVKEPVRSANGSIENLNSYATFLTAHLILDFSVMSIDDYRKIMRLHYESNEYTVECYDTIYNHPIRIKMYFATEEMAKLFTISQHRSLPNGGWEDWVDIVGVSDYKVELIGTNSELDLVGVKYSYNSDITPTGVPVPNIEEEVYIGEEIVVGNGVPFINEPPSYTQKFKEWNTKPDGTGLTYTNGKVITVNDDMTLYAIWESTTSYTLSFNYGLSDVYSEIDSTTGVLTEVLNREITDITDIGVLPPLTEPYVEDANTKKKYYPYTNGGWYKHPVKQNNMQVVSNQAYWMTRDTIIYALYDKKPFTVDYVTNSGNTAIPQQTLTYGDSVYTPTLAQQGYTFQGWFIDSTLVTQFSGSMPPYDITLYAKWEKNK
jgi:uncharacterized repeat protein (TIGR02543 family)